ncbi:hypothetical protein DDV21_011445 [Streptococcus chenjunshii]|uniref:Xylulose kinase n=1 Tax=Streptococcus chenjunshii TaxID=2173853 RepID=A0A372KLD8_9STRE|nr:FGGY family carbohydrate kinase [Streptococcus chenjunshii]AXQ79630.1 hypothetical protein DDV21_011445 [Streptococcus chenjunshii]RFU51055.1 hypothetical protein DDV22_05605 [Streptococcus chenjunshii]RFU53099.1 hypothetical protein DDV23_06400 [Streptococcus chenjunshii]
MTVKLVLGLDIGTSSVKFLVSDSSLNTVYANSIAYDLVYPSEGYVEMDPKVWKKIILDELEKIFNSDFADNIKVICTTAQMHSTVFLDSDGDTFRNAILWNDRRTINQIPEIRDVLINTLGMTKNANIISTGSPLANLIWLKKYKTEEYKKIAKMCMVKDYINYILTGEAVTDYCDASTSCLMDLATKKWSDKIIKHYGFPNRIFPEIKNSDKRVSFLGASLKKRFHLHNDVAVVVGTGDNAATMAFINEFSKSNLTISLGTSGVVLSEIKNLSNVGKNILFGSENGLKIISQTSLSTCGEIIEWWKNEITRNNEYLRLSDISEKDIVSNKVIFIPYFAGEKYILKNRNILGSFQELDLTASSKKMGLSIFEGIAFALKLLYEEQNIPLAGSINVVGGGARNDLWLLILANVFNRVINTFNLNVMSVHGSIIIGYKYLQTPVSSDYLTMIPLKPQSKYVSYYQKKYKKFKKYVHLINCSNG